MTRLATRLEKLEREGRDEGGARPFYLLWIESGSDRQASAKATRDAGKVPADVPIFCAEWKALESLTRRGRTLGPRPRARLTNHARLSDDETAILFETIATDPATLAIATPTRPNRREQTVLVELTDRELVGAILTGSAGSRLCGAA